MLVDLARNDLGRVATAGSVRVEPYRVIERYSHIMHIVSGVNGTLAPGHDAFDLFAATFPAGTLVGAPKVRAMEIIDELEPVGPAALRRYGRLLRAARRHGSGHHHPHAGVSRRRLQLPGRRRHRRRQFARRPSTRKSWRRARCCAARSSIAAEGL